MVSGCNHVDLGTINLSDVGQPVYLSADVHSKLHKISKSNTKLLYGTATASFAGVNFNLSCIFSTSVSAVNVTYHTILRLGAPMLILLDVTDTVASITLVPIGSI